MSQRDGHFGNTSVGAICLLSFSAALVCSGAEGVPDFNRDIRPLLSDKCYPCHGPDTNQRQAELRLDERDALFADRGGYAVVVPGNAKDSELIRRIFAEDAGERMPPVDSKLSLSKAEREVLSRWIEGGANWSDHWSFIPPAKSEPPQVVDASWPRNDIDSFILARLEQAGLSPSERADPERLLRRVTIDLTGLPPTVAEMDQFLSDHSHAAYVALVDRLLSSAACAERLALDWMDLARYADSHGLHADGLRTMWPWRDWVIRAFQENLPYDQFVTWQLAGDLLPHSNAEQTLATAFLRNHPMTAEGGVIDEEFRLSYVFDRVETTATAFLGLTVQCARCHDHKFDPVLQREYYQLAAFFNNVRELGMTGDDGNYGPILHLPTESTRQKLMTLDKKIAAAERRLQAIRNQARAPFDPRLVKSVTVPTGNRYPLDTVQPRTSEKGKLDWIVDSEKRLTAALEPGTVDAIDGHGISIANEYGFLSLAGEPHFDASDLFSAAVWVRPDQRLEEVAPHALRTILGTAGHKNQYWRGWELNLDSQNHLVLQLIHSQPDNLIDIRSDRAIQVGQWTHVGFAYSGSGVAAGIRLFIDGVPASTTVRDDRLTKSILPVTNAVGFPHDEKRAIRMGRSYRTFSGEFGIYRGSMDDLRLFPTALTSLEMRQLFASYRAADAGAVDRSSVVESTDAEQVFEHWLVRECDDYREQSTRLRELRGKRFELQSAVPTVMVMSDMPHPRTTYVLHRGEYSQRREPVELGTPEAVLPFPSNLPPNRLGLARWLFHEDNSLTARVAVNRYWQLLFGNGLVRTPHDFGVQGERPSHPQLLDWLATRFRESGWDTRALLKDIVMSATYQQSSVVRSDLQQHDPENRLLGRSPAYRLSAEAIRDSALAAAGLLTRRVGGPSVKPYQPAGLWIEKNNFSPHLMRYQSDTGEKLYRRSLYTFIRRTSPPPAMLALDATNRSVCTMKREITNTPLQSLVLMNDPQFVEAARVMAERLQKDAGSDPAKQLDLGFRLATGRRPSGLEIQVLQQLYDRQLARFRDDCEATHQLLEVGERPREKSLDAAVTAALTVVANTLMNYDEFYMKR